MYIGIVQVDNKDFKNIVNDYDSSIEVNAIDNHFQIRTTCLEECLDVFSILKNEYYSKITTLIIPSMYNHDTGFIQYVSSNKDYLLFIEDYLWYCITHGIESKSTMILEKLLVDLEYDDLYLLYKYIENGGNASATSKSMYIHRNTMDYRLNKWSKIFMLNIKRPKTLMIISFLIDKNDLIQ